TAEGHGDQQTDAYLSTFSDDYTVVMTISQAGTGSGACGPFVRIIYEAIYGVTEDGELDEDRALLPEPQRALPKIDDTGSIVPQRDPDFDVNATSAINGSY